MHKHHEAERRLKAVQGMGYSGAASRIAELESILRDILAADERGQGLPFAEAMERAHKALQPK